jgi:plastocyanin
LRLLAAGRAFSNAFDGGESRLAVAAGATLRLTDHVALAADYSRLVDLDEVGVDAAWSAGVQLAIPYTPHTLSLHASNASTTTLEGATVGLNRTRWGFEFTVPLTLSRYFGSGGSAAVPPSAPAGDVAAEIGMTNRLRFSADTVRIRAGQTIRWRNTSDVVHTVTADASRAVNVASVRLPSGAQPFDSGNMTPGSAFEYTFTIPGEYTYFCIPHELAGMTGTIIVEAGE